MGWMDGFPAQVIYILKWFFSALFASSCLAIFGISSINTLRASAANVERKGKEIDFTPESVV